MRDPLIVLNNLASKSTLKSYEYQRLYRNLFNPEFYLMAYSKIYAKEGNMTAGTDRKTIDGMSMERINKLIDSMKDESYKPNPAKRVYIDKGNNRGKRPLGIPSIDDKIVQEIVRSLFESIYEGRFSKHSHGFRPKKSCHTALIQVRETFTGVKWFIEGDIKSFFDNINHDILINILRRKIKDERFINLIRKFFNAGYMEDWVYHSTYSGAPQGSILSPIISNIYLHELDKFMNRYKKQFENGKGRQVNPVYHQLRSKIYRLEKKTKAGLPMSLEEKSKIRLLRKELLTIPSTDPMDDNFKRIQYVRYADDFLVGIIGSKQDAQAIKVDITAFLSSELKLELSQEKTLITNSRDKARFLGHNVVVTRDSSTVTNRHGTQQRARNLRCELYLPRDRWVEKLIKLDALEIDKDNRWNPKHRTYLKDHDDLEIVSIYNAEIRGLYNFYKFTKNVSILHKFKYFMEYSMYKTLANKYKSTIPKIIRKFSINGEFGVNYKTIKGSKTRFFYNNGFKRQVPAGSEISYDDSIIDTRRYNGRSSLILRLLANTCEWCGAFDVPIEMHHVRKLKDLKGKKAWEAFMISRLRKTLALCKGCHNELHAGKLD